MPDLLTAKEYMWRMRAIANQWLFF
jgi:hypothetical protein